MTVAAASIKSTIVGYPFKIATGAVAAQNDCVTFAETGIIPFFFNMQNNSTTTASSGGAYVGWRYAEMKATTTYAATDTSIVYDGGTASERTTGSYYARNGRTGEVIFVKTDSGPTTTTGTLTVIRGCLGTTAAAMADEDFLFCLNSLVATGTATGTALVGYFSLPALTKAKVFG
jgi:hypothetical protein